MKTQNSKTATTITAETGGKNSTALNRSPGMPEINTADTPRRDLTVTVCQTKQGRGVHFCIHPLLSGSNSNLWFPLSEREDIHTGIERIRRARDQQ